MGPTPDGRIKPDILAPGVNIESAGSSGKQTPSCGVAMKTGTSMSTPIVAATAALLSQYLEEGYYPSGEPVAADGFVPTAATLKAMIIHSGSPLRGEGNPLFPKSFSNPPPDNHQGFGAMNVEEWEWGGRIMHSVLYWRNASAFNLIIHELEVNTSSSHISFNLTIDPTKKLKITLVWTDPPASSFSSNIMVNDLDVSLNHNGTLFYPNKWIWAHAPNVV